MAVVPAMANGLDNNSPADIWYNWNLMVNEPEARKVLAKAPANGLDTYYFRTRDDTWGVLQITGFSEQPRGVKVRYKLVLDGHPPQAARPSSNPAEPSYQGRKLLDWLADVVVVFGQPSEEQIEKQTRASQAIRQMGTNVIPFLLADLGAGNPPSVKYDREDLRSADERMLQASWAFDALGSAGKPAIPQLVKLLDVSPGYVPGALAGIGREALPELLQALTNENFWVRDNTAADLANAIYRGKISGHEAVAALPIAMRNLSYTNPTNSLYEANTRSRAEGLRQAILADPVVLSNLLAAPQAQ
jgi:hypothetical protein